MSYGIPGEVVDGQDVDVVASAVAGALKRARAGDGPTLLEMKTYRYAGHSRADRAPYRPEGELERWYERDPVNTYRSRLIAEGELTAEDAEEIEARARRSIEDAEAVAKASAKATVDDMFRHIYAP